MKRLWSANVELETIWHKDDQQLLNGVHADQSKGHTVICLDPAGTVHSSESFSHKLFHWWELGGCRLSFVIGGAEGLPSELKKIGKNQIISLSSMTFTHQLARLFLSEQIYRATEIRKGSAYHK